MNSCLNRKLLLNPPQGSDPGYQYVNSRIAERYNRTVNRTGHLWGGRYKSCIMHTNGL